MILHCPRAGAEVCCAANFFSRCILALTIILVIAGMDADAGAQKTFATGYNPGAPSAGKLIQTTAHDDPRSSGDVTVSHKLTWLNNLM